MAAMKGRTFLVKLGDGATSETFTTIAGGRTDSLTVNNEPVDVTSKTNAPWRTLLADAGLRSVTVNGSGVFEDSQSEADFRTAVLAGTIDNYEIVFDNGDKYSGAFLAASLTEGGDYTDGQTFEFSIESSGTITFTAA